MKYKYSILFFLILINIFSLDTLKADDKKKSKRIKAKKINVSLLSVALKVNSLKSDEEFYSISSEVVFRWQPIMTSVREGNLPKHTAIDSLNKYTNELWDFMNELLRKKKIMKYSDADWIFPVKGYSSGAIGGKNGSGYIVSDFDFFDKNSGGHPAHDIFIDDSNQDCLDDKTNLPVEILSMSGGIVVETRKNWTTDMMDIKGGNIVYVYDNFTNGFFYYAHFKEVKVNVGDIVKPGTSLGTMGRTGKNAYPSRSPTHLHLMYVRSFDGDLRPENIYNDLIRVTTIE